MAEVKRPTKSAREFVDRISRKVENSLILDPPEGAETPEELRAAINTAAIQEVIRRVNLEIQHCDVMRKRMRVVQRERRKALEKLIPQIDRLELSKLAHPGSGELADRVSALKVEKRKLRAKWGRAGQAAGEWQRYGMILRSLSHEIERKESLEWSRELESI